MRIRSRMLPPGWYPGSKSECLREIEQMVAGVKPLPPGVKVFGGIVPHAGWYFSGKLAARVFYLNSLITQPQVVAVFGGHLGGNSPPLLVTDEAWETPLGNVTLATEFYEPLRKRLTLKEEYPGDNTIEIQLPLVKHFFPNTKVLALRAPHSQEAIALGEAVAAVAGELKLSLLAFGSTDLTHYGPNYGWAPKGFGSDAVKWVKEVNDKKFVDLALKMDGEGMLKTAAQDQSACSAGGAVAAIAAAKKLGATKANLVDYYTSYDVMPLVDYYTSYDVMPGDSFVGYAGILLEG
ncbi:MAG: AmmeMemoRadiSam system protein B [Deltaproteobacteria bacterium]|nr:AmmeMemoRadiSam system protein B [Deltaproteobacteria bacterium]